MPIAALIVMLVPLPMTPYAADAIPGPTTTRVVGVYDGDTLTVDAEPCLALPSERPSRLSGVDTPEIRGKCLAEIELATRARDFVREKVGERVQIADVKHGKYAGRVVADVLVGRHRAVGC